MVNCPVSGCTRGPFKNLQALKMHDLRVHKKMGAGHGPYKKGGRLSWKLGGRNKQEPEPEPQPKPKIGRPRKIKQVPGVSLEEAIRALEAKRDVMNEIINDLRAMA